jgi:hypothetical protein
MRARKLLTLIAVGLLATILVAGSAPSASGAPKNTVVGKDAEGDWGDGSAPQIGAALGQDLVAAEIGMADKKTINFIIKVTQLPPNGGVPEFTRYQWGMAVNGDYVELDGKWSNYSRGACDHTSGQCPPPRDPGMQPFLVRANCGAVEGQNFTACEEVGIVQATFDPAEGSITIPVPAKLIKAKKGSKITPAMNDFSAGAGGNIVAMPSAYASINNASQLDAMVVTKAFKVR